MNTDSLYLALAEKELDDCIRLELKAEWEHLRSKDCTNNLTAVVVAKFWPSESAVTSKQNLTRENLDSSKGISDTQRCYVYVAKLTTAMMLPQIKTKSVVEP